jgi:hypothetical protein
MIDYNVLGNIIDTSFGRSSTSVQATSSVKLTIVGADRLKAVYTIVVNFRSNDEYIRLKKNYADESARYLAEVLKSVKKQYKDVTGTALKLSEVATDDSLEIINLGIYNPKRTGLYRATMLLDMA